MNYQTARNMSYKELRLAFKSFLFNQGKKENTVNSMTQCVFFIYRNCGADKFWDTVEADETGRRQMILDALHQYSTPKVATYINGYMTSYRRFREFLEVPSAPEIAEGKPTAVAASEETTRYIKHKDEKVLDAQEIERVHKTVIESPDYGTDYELITRAFRKFPLNKDPEIIAMKIALIDMTNSTHLGVHRSQVSTSDLVKLIMSIPDFDERVRQGDPELVNILAKNTGRINLFSFATKYCTYHNVDIYRNDDYSIFDSVVAKSLPQYSPIVTAADITRWRKAYNYQAFSDCITEILDRNEIQIDFRRRKFDHYIWYTNR